MTIKHMVWSYSPIFGLYECKCGKRFEEFKGLRKHLRKKNGKP